MHSWRNAGRPAAVATSAMAASVLIMLAAEPLLAQTSSAQIWPTKRVQVIVPFSPGSATDLLPRTVFEHVAAKVGQTFIIENRPGGGGAMGVSAVAKADPDGYTILVHSNALVTAPAIQSMPYDPVQDFAGVTPLGNVPLVLVISPDKNIKTLKELVAAAKAKPGSINYAAAGIGTPPHLTTERFRLAAQFEGQACAVQGRAGGADRSADGQGGLLFLPDHTRDAVHPRRKAPGACREQLEAGHRAAGCADHGGGGLSRFRFRFLDRHGGAEEDAAGHRRAHAPGDRERAWAIQP